MKKIFTFVILALVAVSVWGAEVIIGSSGSNDTNVPINLSSAYSASQSIYTATELTTAGLSANVSISKIAFKYAASTEYTRNIKVYVTNRSSDVAATYMSSYKFDKVTSSDLYFDGAITTPTTSGTFYEITLSKNFVWDGTSNICIIVCDNTGTSGGAYKYHKASSVSTTPGRCIYSTGSSVNPTSSYTNAGGKNDYRPIIQITYTTGDTPTPTPTINNPSPSSLEYGTIYLDEGNVEKTFKVTASDLTNDITLTTNASAGVTISPSEIAKDNTDLAVDGVAVTVTLSKGYPFPITNPTVTIASEGATSKSVTIKATEGSFSSLSTMESLNTNGYFLLDFDATISSINSEEKTMTIKKVSTKNANYALIDGIETFAVGGKFSGLKGKYENEVFKIFSYTNYTAPAPTSVVEVDEDFDHSADWADIEDGENVSTLTIKRTIVPNEWNSIVLPTYLTSTEVSDYFGAGTDVEAFSGAVVTSSRVTLNFTPKTDGIEAGVPYLIKPKQALPNPLNLTNHSFKKTVSPDTYDGIEFVGVLVPTDIDGSGDDYIIVGSGNTLLHPSGAGTIKGMRAYFHVVGPAAKAAIRKSPTISLSTGSTTAMTLVKPDAGKAYKAIENGRIVIKANGKKVNVLGQTVK